MSITDDIMSKPIEQWTTVDKTEWEKSRLQDDEDIKETIEQAKKETNDILKYGQYNGKDRIISSHDIAREYAEKGETGHTFITGMCGIDRLIDFQTGEVIIITGAQKNGKTSLSQTFTKKFAEHSVSVLWFTYEVSQQNFLKKYSHSLNPDNIPLFYMPKKNTEQNLVWIEQRITEAQVKFHCDIVFIDHLHYLIPLKETINASLLIGGIMRELKKIAISRNVVIFLLCHLKKVDIVKVPDLSDIRDSSFISQESDTIMFIKRHGKVADGIVQFENTSGLYVLANRRTGKLGYVPLVYVDNMFHVEEGREMQNEHRPYIE